MLLPMTATLVERPQFARNAAAVDSVRITLSPAFTMPKPDRLTVPALRESSSKLQPVMSIAVVPMLVNSMNFTLLGGTLIHPLGDLDGGGLRAAGEYAERGQREKRGECLSLDHGIMLLTNTFIRGDGATARGETRNRR